MHDQTAVEPLIDALADQTPAVRAAAAGALGEAEDQRAIMPLLLSQALHTLVALGDIKAISRLKARGSLVKEQEPP